MIKTAVTSRVTVTLSQETSLSGDEHANLWTITPCNDAIYIIHFQTVMHLCFCVGMAVGLSILTIKIWFFNKWIFMKFFQEDNAGTWNNRIFRYHYVETLSYYALLGYILWQLHGLAGLRYLSSYEFCLSTQRFGKTLIFKVITDNNSVKNTNSLQLTGITVHNNSHQLQSVYIGLNNNDQNHPHLYTKRPTTWRNTWLNMAKQVQQIITIYQHGPQKTQAPINNEPY